MKDLWFGIGVWSAAAAIGAVAFPDLLAPIASAWTLIVLGRLMFELEDAAYGLTRRESDFDVALAARERKTVRPPDLVRLEGSLGWGTYEPREFDHHVRPLLRELIEHRKRRRDPAASISSELEALTGPARAEALYDRAIETADLERITRGIEEL